MLLISFRCAVTSTIADFIQKSIAQHDIVVFAFSYCPYCKRAREELQRVAPESDILVINMDLRTDGKDMLDALATMTGGQRTVPNIFVKGRHIGGLQELDDAIKSGGFTAMLS